jgi:hypothetical protein
MNKNIKKKEIKINIGDEISLFGVLDSDYGSFKILDLNDFKIVDVSNTNSNNFLFTGKVIYMNKSSVFLEVVDVYPKNHECLDYFDDSDDVSNYVNHVYTNDVFKFNLSSIKENILNKDDAMNKLLQIEENSNNIKKQIENKMHEVLQLVGDISSICNEAGVEPKDINSDLEEKTLKVVRDLGWSTSSFFC